MSAHTCHYPGCQKEVPENRWGCKPHWFSLPQHIRARIWATYRAGQEIDKNPSREYVLAAHAAQRYIERKLKAQSELAASPTPAG